MAAESSSGRRATQADVAKLAGVSGATVSYVMNGSRTGRSAPASEEVRRRVLTAAEKLGYRPQHAGRSLSRGRSDLVAMLSPPILLPWHREIARQFDAVSEAHGYTVVHLVNNRGVERFLPMLTNGTVDGLLTLSWGLDHQQRSMLARRLPMLTFSDRRHQEGYDLIRNHSREGIRKAVRHLAASGRRRIAYISSNRDPGYGERWDGFLDGMTEVGIERHRSLMISSASTPIAMTNAAISLLHSSPLPDAVVTDTASAAIATLQIAAGMGISVPDDLAVIGAGNVPEATATSPSLTTVGYKSTDFRPLIGQLFTRIDQPSGPARTLDADWDLVPRGSA